MEEGADKAKNEVGDLKDATDSLIQGFSRDLPEFEITDPDVAREQAEALETAADARADLIEDAQTFAGLSETERRLFADADPSDFSDPELQLRAREAAPLIERFGEIGDIEAFIDRNQQLLRVERGIAQSIDSRVNAREDELRVLRRIRSLQGVRLADTERGPRFDTSPRRVRTLGPESVQPDEVSTKSEFERDFGMKAPTTDDLRGLPEAAEKGSEQMENVNRQLVQSIRLGFQLGETLVSAFQRGEVEANKLLGQLLQIVGQAVSLVNPAAGAVTAGVGGLIGSFDEGGYTGPGARSQPAGIVHAGEYVMPKEAVDALGLDFFRSIHQAAAGPSKADLDRIAGVPGYASGGLVRAMTRPAGRGGEGGRQQMDRLVDEVRRLRDETRRLAERPNVVQIPDRGARDIVEAGIDYDDTKRARPS